MPDLGDYAVPVILGYAVSAIALGALVWASLAAHARARRELKELENE